MSDSTPVRMLSGVKPFDTYVGDTANAPYGPGILPGTAVVFRSERCPGAFWRLGLAFARTAPRTVLATSNHYSIARLVEAGAVPQITLGGDPAPVLIAEFLPTNPIAQRATFTTWERALRDMPRTPAGVMVIDEPCDEPCEESRGPREVFSDALVRNFAAILVHYQDPHRFEKVDTHIADIAIAHAVVTESHHELCVYKHRHSQAPLNVLIHPSVFPSPG